MEKIKLLSLFSGIGSFETALKRKQIPYELVNYCEIDKTVSRAYSVLHNEPEDKNLGDIREVKTESLADFDLMVWGFPCQDISISNVKGKGLKGERSGLYAEGIRILKAKKPTYSIIENVDNLVSKKFKDSFEQVMHDLDEAGYDSHWEILNACDFGIPQSRKRVFIVSIRKDISHSFTFPQPSHEKTERKKWWEFINPLETRSLTNRQQMMIDAAQGKREFEINIEGVPQFDCSVITLRQTGLRFQNNAEHPTILAHFGKGGGNFTMLAYQGHIGGITPLQCFKLMGFSEDDYHKLEEKGFSQSSLYAMVGNSIVVNVLEAVLEKLLIKK